MSSRNKPNSSVAYQVLLRANVWYSWALLLCGLLLFWYKGALLPYPRRSLVSEVVLFVLLAGVDGFRNFFGRKGNLTENTGQVIVSLVLSVPVLVCLLFFVLWQTFVLRLEVILFGIQMAFVVLELLFGGVAIASIARGSP